jgi:hypothetical protein
VSCIQLFARCSVIYAEFSLQQRMSNLAHRMKRSTMRKRSNLHQHRRKKHKMKLNASTLRSPRNKLRRIFEEVPLSAKRKRDDDEDDTPENEPHRCSERIASHSSQSPQIPQRSRSSQQSVSGQCNTRSGAAESYEYSPVEVCPAPSESWIQLLLLYTGFFRESAQPK